MSSQETVEIIASLMVDAYRQGTLSAVNSIMDVMTELKLPYLNMPMLVGMKQGFENQSLDRMLADFMKIYKERTKSP